MILKAIGCSIKREGSNLIIDPSNINSWIIPDSYVREIRSSIIFLGSMLARMGKAQITYPGGCEIGQRPIDLHLKGLKQLGWLLTNQMDICFAKLRNLKVQLYIWITRV